MLPPRLRPRTFADCSNRTRRCWLGKSPDLCLRRGYHVGGSSSTRSKATVSPGRHVVAFFPQQHHNHPVHQQQQRRHLSFSFAGPRTLDDIIKKDLLESKSGAEIADIWYTYHQERDNVHGLVYKGKDGKDILSRASSCPFFVQPIFREDGFFMMISQFQEPSHFLMAYLEDYKMDPSAAQPLLTFSVFEDYADTKDLTLVRCDILNKGLHDEEGRKIVENTVDSYKCDVEFATVKTFNQRPNAFDVDDYIARQNEKWRKDPPSISV